MGKITTLIIAVIICAFLFYAHFEHETANFCINMDGYGVCSEWNAKAILIFIAFYFFWGIIGALGLKLIYRVIRFLIK